MSEQKTGKKWLFLIIGIGVIALFVFGIAPLVVEKINIFREMGNFIKENNIETDAYVYSDSELSGRAELGARSTIEHPPKGPSNE